VTTTTLPVEIGDAMQAALKAAAKDWTMEKRKMRRSERGSTRQVQDMRRSYKVTVKDAAYQVMPEAYNKASAGGTLPANARQIMYAARPMVLKLTGGQCWKNSSYFTQVLLPDYVNEYDVDWDVVFDARGHLREPHGGAEIGLGTLEARRYVESWVYWPGGLEMEDLTFPLDVQTSGPANQYGAVLFVEKEGFDELWRAVKLTDRYDLAIMSTKGMSVTAARSLVEEVSNAGVRVFVLRDFDKAGFSIVHTLAHDTRRYQFSSRPNVTDLGLRLIDVEDLGLEGEAVTYKQSTDPRKNLYECGATRQEADYLCKTKMYRAWGGQRVELNAMNSAQLVAWLEGKLQAAGVVKVVPAEAVLAATYRKAKLVAEIQKEIDRVVAAFDGAAVVVPGDLCGAVEQMIQNTPRPWSWAVERLAGSALDTTPTIGEAGE